MSHHIDKIFYINLDKRTDRREQIEQELATHGLEAERFAGIPTFGCGMIGCGYSHLSVLKLARERGYKNVLILEDDFQFVVSKEEMENSFQQFFDASIPYDVLMISYVIQKSADVPDYPFLKKVLDGQTTSGYLVNHHYYDVIIQLYEWAIPLLEQTRMHWEYAIDMVWKRLQPEGQWFHFTQRLGKQRPSYSDNTMRYEEYDG